MKESGGAPPADSPRRRRPGARAAAEPPVLRRLVFALIPALFLLAALEAAARLGEWAVPELRSLPLPEEYAGLLVPDAELGWAVRADMRQRLDGVLISTNELGLRSAAVAPKARGEFRLLVLGESSAFGIGVQQYETFPAVLEGLLNERGTRPYRVINAGVPAYSSFQSLLFLEQRGLRLKPDLVLFYHELNDYLPSSLRDSSNDTLGVSRTDQQWHATRRSTITRRLLAHSALYRFAALRLAERRITKLQREARANPLSQIGLLDIALPPRLTNSEQTAPAAAIEESLLPPRVSPEERWENLRRLRQICQAREIELVIIHPAYSDSRRHECLLTRFCSDTGTLMFEAYDALHPPEAAAGLFLDPWHPTVLGHRRLAQQLAGFLEGHTRIGRPTPKP